MEMRCDPQQIKRWKDELAEVILRLGHYRAAETAILTGAQEYRIGSRSLRRVDLQLIVKEAEQLRRRRDDLERALLTCRSPNRRPSVRVIPRDL